VGAKKMTSAFMCLALTVYFEARGEALSGQIFVADVVLNRVESPKYPNTVCEVIKQKSQFSYYWDGKPDVPKEKQAWKQSKWVAHWMLSSRKHYIDSCNYYADSIDYPSTWRKLKFETKLGRHLFYEGSC